MEHRLKIDEPYLDSKLAGDKLFEIRYDDRGYQKGDTVYYGQFDQDDGWTYYYFEITYVTAFQQKDGWVVFGEKFLKKSKDQI